MAGENATDDDFNPAPLDDGAIDDAVGDLRDVLKKDAGEAPVLNDESMDGMGGAASLDSDFGADFGNDSAAAADDPFNIGDAPETGAAEFGGDDLSMGAPDLGATDFGGTADFGGTDFGGDTDFGGGADFGGAAGQDFGAAAAAAPGPTLGATGANTRVDLVMGIPVDVQIILGSSRMAVSSLMELSEGATIALDRKIGEPVEIMVNGKMIGRGEITVLDSDDTKFAVRIIEVIGAPQKKTD
ncbi:flagellar motor switch protein FliN [Hoeflea phototrophica DFL-43]|uniref:Flagellar motor switch protein FliN n=1 Tax=Hoeflea phototrophica (strain DSM 17068 / NCIMB 14078 / DFL-43) TaxID=411684 RepID=A9CYK3_HOEPD|nr:flagellar motor switch protein FliN [Hoeflea phototrophica]EDQ34577.1 flagellar motor switch protein FliN [Hoeflea phototrophica DFL-43]